MGRIYDYKTNYTPTSNCVRKGVNNSKSNLMIRQSIADIQEFNRPF